jgi:hypothetical protein
MRWYLVRPSFLQLSFKWKAENYIQWLIEKIVAVQWYRYCGLHHVLHISSNVPPRHKFFSRRSLLVAVPTNLTPPPLPPHRIWSDVHVLVEHLLGTRRGDNRWMPNPINMVYGITPPLLKCWIYFTVWRAVYGRALSCRSHKREDIKPTASSSNCWLKLIPKPITVPVTLFVHTKLSRAVSYYEFYTNFPLFI